MNTIIIGNRIAEGRKQSGLSQARLADLMAVSPQAVSKWERGESMPDILLLNTLADIFKVDLNYFSAKEICADEKQSNVLKPGNKKTAEWDMSLSEWKNADFSGLGNLKNKFSGSNIISCKFCGSNLANITFKGNNIKNATLQNQIYPAALFRCQMLLKTLSAFATLAAQR